MYNHALLKRAVPTSLPTEIADIILTSKSSHSAAATLSHSAALSAMTANASTGMTASGDSQPGAENGECKLLGPFALLVQGALGLLALLSLVYKRWRERPQRPVKIWAFDASKQVVGSALLHIANLLMSMLSSGELTIKADHYQTNPCSFYLLNLAIDTTVGIPILVVLLRLLTYAFSLTPLGNPPESIHSGNYGRPPKASWWLKQSFIYFIGLLGMKFCVFIIFQLCPWIIQVGDWALRWTEGNTMVQIFFVMLFFPVVMNAIQYYIIDSFIKDQKPADHEPIPSEDGDGNDSEEEQRRHSLGSYDETSNDVIGEERMKNGTEIEVHEDENTLKRKSDSRKDADHTSGSDDEGRNGGHRSASTF
ncbi:hypothetical protein ACLMJK_008068 [Lecanora helva]